MHTLFSEEHLQFRYNVQCKLKDHVYIDDFNSFTRAVLITTESRIVAILLSEIHFEKDVVGGLCMNDLEMHIKTHPICKSEIHRNLPFV